MHLGQGCLLVGAQLLLNYLLITQLHRACVFHSAAQHHDRHFASTSAAGGLMAHAQLGGAWAAGDIRRDGREARQALASLPARAHPA